MSELDVERLARAMCEASHEDWHRYEDQKANWRYAQKVVAEYARLAESRPSDGLAVAAREYLLHDGSGIRRTDQWAGDFDAIKLSDARERLRAALTEADSGAPGKPVMSVAMSDSDEGPA
jgi:hypothetical protein